MASVAGGGRGGRGGWNGNGSNNNNGKKNLPDLDGKFDRYCPFCTLVIPDQAHLKLSRCPHPRCLRLLPFPFGQHRNDGLQRCRNCGSLEHRSFKCCSWCGRAIFVERTLAVSFENIDHADAVFFGIQGPRSSGSTWSVGIGGSSAGSSGVGGGGQKGCGGASSSVGVAEGPSSASASSSSSHSKAGPSGLKRPPATVFIDEGDSDEDGQLSSWMEDLEKKEEAKKKKKKETKDDDEEEDKNDGSSQS